MSEKYSFVVLKSDITEFYDELRLGTYLFTEQDILDHISSNLGYTQIKKFYFYKSADSEQPYVRLTKREKTTSISGVNFLHGCHIYDGKLVWKNREDSDSSFFLSKLLNTACAWFEFVLDNLRKPFLMIWTMKPMPSRDNSLLVIEYLRLFADMIREDRFSME